MIIITINIGTLLYCYIKFFNVVEHLNDAIKNQTLQEEKELLEISEFGFEHAKEQVRDLQAAVDLYRMNPHGAGNQEMLNKLIFDVQQNKQAMYLLNNADDSLD